MSRSVAAGVLRCAAFIIISGWVVIGQASDDRDRLLLNDDEIAKIVSHGPWPQNRQIDASNRVSGNPLAAKLGKLLFFDTRLSSNGKIACSTCHNPNSGWTDGKARAGGLERLDRNTQSLFNVSGNRWFGWGGQNDSLWAHSIGPILDPREMGATPENVAAILRQSKSLSAQYRDVFGVSPDDRDPLELLVDAAKALAAFQETITSGRTPFDNFRDALARKDFKSAREFPVSAQRGAALFVGRAKCNLCHIGARFSSDEFDDAGVPYFTGPGRVDRGRFEGINKLKASPFNKLGRFNDSSERESAWATKQVAQTHRTFGQFRVPSLRQLTSTAPYMHNGSLKTVRDVVDHYSNINLDRIHSDAAPVLSPLNLTEQESEDLVLFLKSLSTQLLEHTD
ncbi:MAG: cytochrome c peroxidase [Hyphomicrobiales bacterium]